MSLKSLVRAILLLAFAPPSEGMVAQKIPFVSDRQNAGPVGVLDRATVPRYGEIMNLTVEIPDELARSLNAAGGDLSRSVLETLALDEYRADRLSKDALCQALGFETSYQLDGFLKEHGVWIEYDAEDIARERATLERLCS